MVKTVNWALCTMLISNCEFKVKNINSIRLPVNRVASTFEKQHIIAIKHNE